MNLLIFSVVILTLVCSGATAPLDSDNQSSTMAEIKIPPYIKKIYKKMSQAMEEGDLHTSLKFLRIIRTVHWLEPVTQATTTLSTDPYKYQYTIEFNTSVLSHKKHHPNYAELFLHMLTKGGHNPAEIKIDSSHIQQPITWRQPSQASGEDDSQTAEAVQSVRISLTSLSNSSLWLNDSTLTITVASTNPIRMPSGNHYQTAVGLVLYMGGAPEAIDHLLTTPIPSAVADHTLPHHKQSLGIGATRKRRATGSTPCQLQGGFKVKFLEVRGGYERIIQPEMVDIKKCVGECPHFLHHLHNPTQHAEVRNLLHFREGSAGADITPASCVPTSFKPLPVIVYNEADKSVSTKTYNELVAASCGCR